MRNFFLLSVVCALSLHAQTQPKANNASLLDQTTRLMWQDNEQVLAQTRKWQDAQNYCNDLILENFEDWRLPTTNELKEALNKLSFKHTSKSKSFWSSSPDVFLPFDPWLHSPEPTSDTCCPNMQNLVRCVRNYD